MSKVEQQLSSILPPREINKDGAMYIQRVASEPASRKTIIEKSELLDKLLVQAQVRVKNGVRVKFFKNFVRVKTSSKSEFLC